MLIWCGSSYTGTGHMNTAMAAFVQRLHLTPLAELDPLTEVTEIVDRQRIHRVARALHVVASVKPSNESNVQAVEVSVWSVGSQQTFAWERRPRFTR
jgi:hypothetical protein